MILAVLGPEAPPPSYYLPPTEDTLSVSRPMDTLSATRGHYFSIC
jgi:hypothetical protein